MTLSRWWAAALAVLLAFTASVLGVASAAQAHGGPIELTVGDDGTGIIMMTATYIDDGHQVEDIIEATATAVSPTGEQVGPLQLFSGDLGPFTWSTREPLAEGQWEVTVTTTAPADATITTPMTIQYVTDTSGPAGGQGIDTTLLYVGIGVAALVLIVLIVLIVLRLRARKA
ncbi:hypothetical protein LH407_09690 [Antiquaquibacter oligotrophicus]|nr:hypothetical protein [Antiquaquibacter oligotrophicus]UDF12430.1 hypothetical protein LH407_09690 [Antiquaquibacter oligotrophicus]